MHLLTTQSAPISVASWKARAEAILRIEAPFIYSAEFECSEIMSSDKAQVEEQVLRPDRGGPAEFAALAKPASGGLFGTLTSLKTPLLSPELEQSLFRRMNYLRYRVNVLRSRLAARRPSRKSIRIAERLLAEGEVIRCRLIESNTRLVVSIASKITNHPQELEEFTCEGLLIILNAVEKFDYSRGFRFSTYATHAVQRHLFRLRHRNHRRAERFTPAAPETLNDLGRATLVVDESAGAAADREALCRRLLESAEAVLDQRERQIIRLRFGLEGERAHTLREIAGRLGISKERVRQIQIHALARLQELLERIGGSEAILDGI
jgi:RNA polymerase primary sigma factor